MNECPTCLAEPHTGPCTREPYEVKAEKWHRMRKENERLRAALGYDREEGEVCEECGYEALHIARRIDALHTALQDLARAGEETVTAGHPTGSLLTSLVWAQQALYGEVG